MMISILQPRSGKERIDRDGALAICWHSSSLRQCSVDTIADDDCIGAVWDRPDNSYARPFDVSAYIQCS